jgi:conflict system pore-forming effector with SLATT domain/uncharacterized protein DUF4231
MSQLQRTLDSQRTWSRTGNALKARHEMARRLCFVLTIIAALLAAMASQLPDSKMDPQLGNVRQWLSIGSAVLLALVALFTVRFVAGKSDAWARARSASEALKRIAWTYAAKAAPYDDPATRDNQVRDDRQKIEDGVDDLLAQQVAPSARDSSGSSIQPSDSTTREDYVDKHARAQATWYAGKADKCHHAATVLRRYEFVLAVIATVLTAVIGLYGKTPVPMTKSLSVDFVALTGVITTISGAIVAYIEASRLDFLVNAYRAAGRHLRDLLADTPAAGAACDVWSAFVQKAENIMATENGAWQAKLGKG